jgi:hypothetical protein
MSYFVDLIFNTTAEDHLVKLGSLDMFSDRILTFMCMWEAPPVGVAPPTVSEPLLDSLYPVICWPEHRRRSWQKKYSSNKKSNPATRHSGAWGERRYISYSFLTSALDGGKWSASRPGRALPPGKDPRYPLYRRLCGPQSRSGHRG